MRKNGAAWKFGVTCAALCLLLRFHGALMALLSAPATGEFLLYLETGRRSAQAETVVPVYAPESPAPADAKAPEALALPVLVAEPTPEAEPAPPVFTARDGAGIRLYNTAGVTVDPESAILEEPEWPDLPGPKVLIYSTHATESYQKAGEPCQSGVVCYLPADFTAGGGQSDLSKGCGEVRWPSRLACADGRHGRRRGVRDTGNAFRRPGLRGAV